MLKIKINLRAEKGSPKHREAGRTLSQCKDSTRSSRTPMAQSDLADKEMRDIPMVYRLISMVRGKVL